MASVKLTSVYAQITARLDKYEKDLAKAKGMTDRGATKIQKRINKISFSKASQSIAKFTRLFNVATAALVGGGAFGSLIKISSDYEQSVFQMSQTFQGQTDAMIKKAEEMAARFKYFYDFNDISYAFTKTADSMERYGITGNKYIQLVARAADIGAAKNLQLKESIDRIESAMRGEAEASEYLGLTLNDTYMKNIAFDGALKNTWETMTDMQKTQHRYNELMVQSAKYSGVAEKAANTLSGSMTSLGKAIKDRLHPYLEGTNTLIASMISRLRDLWTAEEKFTKRSGLEKQQADLLKRQASIQAAIGEISKSNTPNKQTIIDRMFTKLGLVQEKLMIVSGELYALGKQSEKTLGPVISSGGAATSSGAAVSESTPKPSYGAASAFEMNRFRQAEVLKRDAMVENSAATYQAMDAHVRAWESQTEKSFNAIVQLSERTAWAMQDNFSDLFFDAMRGGFKSLADYANAALASIQRAVADLAAQSLTTGLFGKDFGGGGWLSGIGSFFSGPSGSPYAPAHVGAGGTTAFKMDSGGHIGEGVKGVGLKSGKSYEFHPNETVIPDGKMGGGNNVIINNYSGINATQEQRPNPNGGRDTIVTIGSRLVSEGVMDKIMKVRYGIAPAGKLI